jgi:inhibitor of cysteine peptidase
MRRNKILLLLHSSLVIIFITLLSNTVSSTGVQKTAFGEPKTILIMQPYFQGENIKNTKDDLTSKIVFVVNSTMGNNKQEQNITVKKDYEFTITLESNPTTGYQWIPTFNPEIINLVSHSFQPSSSRLMGAPGTEVFTFKAINHGTGSLKMVYKRSWEKEPVKEKVFPINVA